MKLKNYMKSVKTWAIALIMAGSLASCNDWLELVPENGITVDEFWQSGDDVHSAVMGCYASMLGGSNLPTFVFLWGEVRADMISSYRLINYDYQQIVDGEIRATNSIVQWASFYKTINLCNTVLEKAPAVMALDPSFTQADLDKYKGEVLALRALMYFYLTRMYDEVPLVLEATSSDANVVKRPKATRKAIYDQIKADLLEAEQLCPYSYSKADENKGRITRYTVNTIQADVFLWDEDYDMAILSCNKVINSGQYALYPGENPDDWFYKLYVEGNSPEGIFELQFAADILNPYYALFEQAGVFRANPDVMEYLFPIDVLASENDFDIRGDRASFRSSRNYNIWKYIGINRSEAKTATEATSNWIVYRYADVLLMKAEALAQTDGGLDEALAIVKQIRNRAGAIDMTEQTPDSKDGLINYIVDERGREFAFEGKRWFDVLRNAKRDNYRRIDLLTDMVKRSAPVDRLTTILSKYNDTLSHYFPIPQSDIDANFPLLEQNPFYAEK